MIIHNNYCIVDFETQSKDPNFNQPISIGAVMIDGRKLTICDRGTFYSTINFIRDDEVALYNLAPLEQQALDINKLSADELTKSPPLKKVWGDFINWVNYFNPSKDPWEGPIMCGHNVDYDKTIMRRIMSGHLKGITLPSKLIPKTKIKGKNDSELAQAYKELVPYKEPWKFGPNHLFHPVYTLDTMSLSIALFENHKSPHTYSLDSLRSFFGLSHQSAHNALIDVLNSAEILVRYLRLFREVCQQTDFSENTTSILEIEKYIR